jgi:two-component system sensor histidine kinase MtrB
LGLSICKSVVKEHSGAIEAANVPGGGAVFTVTLPAAAPSS